jgi:hypothetical protein
VDADKAERWIEKLERGRVLMEGWPKYEVGLSGSGGLMIKFASPNPNSIKQVAQQLREMGLEEGDHFTVKMPEGGEKGYVYIRREGLAYAAWLSVHGEDEKQRRLAEAFVKHILRRAEEACGGVERCAVYEKAEKIVEEGKAWNSLTLNEFKGKVEVNGREYVVKVIGWSVELEESESGKLLLRIKITAEVDGVRRAYTITFGRYGKINAVLGFATVRAGREAEAERLSALIKALTGKEPRIRRMKNGQIMIVCNRGHLEGFRRFAELADAITRWLEKTSR